MVTCNYVARNMGVNKMMRISEAKKQCPSLVICNGEDLTHYREMSYKITGVRYSLENNLSTCTRTFFGYAIINISIYPRTSARDNNIYLQPTSRSKAYPHGDPS